MLVQSYVNPQQVKLLGLVNMKRSAENRSNQIEKSEYFRKLAVEKHKKRRIIKERRPPPLIRTKSNRVENEEIEEYDPPQTRAKSIAMEQEHAKKMVVVAEINSLQSHNCKRCSNGPLDLSNIERPESDQMYLHVVCKTCNFINPINLFPSSQEHDKHKRGRKSNPVARKAALGSLHQGFGHTHYEGLMANIGIPSISASTFKRAEREVGRVVEQRARESCDTWRSTEKEASNGDGMKASFDQGWQKQGRAHNSRTGQGTLVGLHTKKCIDFATKNTYCRVCAHSEKNGVSPPQHDCRKNHQGSSKSMEGNIIHLGFKKPVFYNMC